MKNREANWECRLASSFQQVYFCSTLCVKSLYAQSELQWSLSFPNPRLSTALVHRGCELNHEMSNGYRHLRKDGQAQHAKKVMGCTAKNGGKHNLGGYQGRVGILLERL